MDNTELGSAADALLQQDKAQQVRNNITNVSGQNPDQAAQYQHLAAYVNVPVESVQQDPAAIKAQASAQRVDADNLAATAPRTTAYLTDPNNAAKSHDDVHNLAGVEAAVKALPAPRVQPPGWTDVASALPPTQPTLRDKLTDWWASVVGGPSAAQQHQAQDAAEANAILAARQSNPALRPQAGATPAQIDDLNNQAWEQSRQAVGGMSQIPQVAAERFLNAASFGLVSPNNPVKAHSWQSSTAGAVGSLAGFIAGPAKAGAAAFEAIPGAARLAPTAGEAWATGVGKAVLQQAGVLGAASGLQEAGGALLDSHSMAEGAQRVAHGAASGAAIGGIFGAAGKLLPDNTLAQWAGRAVGVSAAQDLVTGTNPLDDRPLEDKLFGYGMNAVFTANGAGRSGGNWFTSNPDVRTGFNDANRAQDAMQGQQAIQALGEMATASKTRERDPAAFRQLVQDMTENGNLKDVYISAKDLGDVLNQSGVTPDQLARQMPEVAAQIQEATTTNGDVRIPVEDYATHIAGGPVDAALLPHLKTDAEGMTFKEAQDHMAGQQESMQATAEKISADAEKRAARDADGQGVHDDVLAQLDQLKRFNPDVNKQYAALMRSFFETQGERHGMTAREVYDMSGLNIKGTPVVDGLDQANRGGYNPETSTLALLKAADLSTFLHESGHFFLDATTKLAAREGAPDSMRAEAQSLLTHLGHDGDLSSWLGKSVEEQRAAHEQFAVGFEKYLMEGKAPTIELQGLFSRFRSWLVNIYKSLSNLDVKLAPEVRGIMDRMLASDEAIREAEQTRDYKKLFDNTDDSAEGRALFDRYQTLGARATDEAIADMTGRSMRDQRWSSNAVKAAKKLLTQDQKNARRAIEEQATKEVQAQPVERARQYLKNGKQFDAAGNELPDTRPPGAPVIKLDSEVLKKMYPKDALGNPDLGKLRGLTAKDGLHPDLVAEQFGLRDGHELVRQLTEAQPAKDQIRELTDQRMLEQHGELIDAEHIEQAANEAVHNESRAKFMATGLKLLSKSLLPVRQILRAAREVAEASIAGKRIRDLRPTQHLAAEARSNREALKLAPKDPAGAVQAQRAALLNNQLFRASDGAVREIQKSLKYLAKFKKESTRAKLDVDIRDQIDDLLGRFDLRQNTNTGPTRAQQNLQTWYDSQVKAGYTPAISADMLNPAIREHYRDMTVEQFRGLVDSIKAMEHIGRERNIAIVNGKRVDLNELVKTRIVPKLEEAGVRFTPDELVDRPSDRTNNKFAQALMHFQSWMRAVAAQLKPQEFKRNQYDRHELLGPMGESIFEPVMNANYHKVDMLKGLSDDFTRMANEQGKEWQKSLRDTVDNRTLVDPDKGTPDAPQLMRFTRARMLGMAIHIGNESNFDKLTKGWGWQPEQVWSFLHEHMTEKDWKATQGIWDLYEKHWPDMEAMNRRLGNTSPDKIEPRAFPTKFGEQRGGYAAISYDPLRSRRGEKEQQMQAIDPGDGLFGRGYFKADTTTNGSLNSRAEGYTDRVELDFHHIATRLHETIHDLAYRETAISVNKIIEHPDFRKSFRTAYGPEAYKSLQEWLGKVVNSENGDQQVGALGRFLQYSRTGMVMTAIAFRPSTVLKHGGSAGIKTLGYFVGGGEKYLASRFAAIGTDYTAEITGAKEKFGEIRARLLQQDRDYKVTSTALFEPEHLQGKMERFGHAAVAWGDMMTAVPTAWAAYDRAITEGIPVNQGGTGKPMTEAQAVNYANKIVREAHGSNVESARSMFLNTGSETLKMFGTLYGFMNNSYGQAVDGYDKLHTAGISNPAVFARSFMALIVPAIWAHYLTHGGPSDDETWAEWIGKAVAGEVAGMVPLVRDMVAMVEGYSHAGVVGVESWLNTIVKAGMDVKNMAQGKEVKAPIKDIGNAIGQGLHIPGAGFGSAALQYEVDVQTGKEHPENGLAHAKGLVLGHGDKKH